MSLTTDMRVSALLRTCQIESVPAYVVRRGDPDAGALIIKQAHLNGTARIFLRQYGSSGEMEWTCLSGEDTMPEPEADAYLERRASSDPDLWVVEIEKAQGLIDLSLY